MLESQVNIEPNTSKTIKSESKVDKLAVEQALNYITEDTGRFTVSELRIYLKGQGFSFGSPAELAEFAEKAKVRYHIGRLIDKNGKRKFVSTKEQLTLSFGSEHIYCKAELIRKESDEERQNLDWLRKHLIALIKRAPLLPQWAIAEIVSAIESVFKRMGKAS